MVYCTCLFQVIFLIETKTNFKKQSYRFNEMLTGLTRNLPAKRNKNKKHLKFQIKQEKC